MKMRIPSLPLMNVDPYFSVWSHDRLTDRFPTHWTGSPNSMVGTVTVDGKAYRFLGLSEAPAIPQVSVDVDAMSTTVVYENEAITLTARFTSPLLITDLYYASRPVTYLQLRWDARDGADHTVSARVSCSEELVLNKAGEGRACSAEAAVKGGTSIRMGSGSQKVLHCSGDDVRIDWGWFYLTVRGSAQVGNEVFRDLYAVYAETALAPDALFAFAYDDIASIEYFGRALPAYWKKDGKTIEAAIAEALADYETLDARCAEFSRQLWAEALEKGGEAYAELLTLAYRQVMAAHKLVADENGEILFISKECFSNGCAATVDVTYPSAPLFLRYNPELLKGMLRPIFRYADSEAWPYDFAPHDAGQYPLVNGQRYGMAPGCRFPREESQMPVEECGNMIILVAALADADGNADFALRYLPLLERWIHYLEQYGEDPAYQLCTDDFAGHLAHNVNLSIKAIMGLAGYSRILSRLGREAESAEWMEKARAYADSLLRRAANDDGSYRLAFDRPGTFSLKYNAVWDKLWGTGLFPAEFFAGELARYRREAKPYGVPLDSREAYTKSDWLHWAACLSDSREEFAFFTDLLWQAYHTMRTRVPMTDWYYTDTSEMRGFQHRTVQGGLYLRLLFD